jgi:hypothetical protein
VARQEIASLSRELPVLDRPAGAPASYEEHVKLMFDLEVLAYQLDLTRVSSQSCSGASSAA